MSIIYPCKDCKARHVGCHSSCDKYITKVKEAENLSAEKRKECRKYDSMFDAMSRMKKRRRHKTK
jgi:hypothetical protein